MGHINKILVPMDGSPSSIRALAQALTLAEDLDGEIEVLHVSEPEAVEHASAGSAVRSAQAEADRSMEEAIADAKLLLGDRLSQRSESGEPIRTIVDVAASGQADLIVMGTQGRVGRLHELVSSVAEGVMRNAPCPVLTVRQPDGESESFAERIHGRQAVADQPRPTRR